MKESKLIIFSIEHQKSYISIRYFYTQDQFIFARFETLLRQNFEHSQEQSIGSCNYEYFILVCDQYYLVSMCGQRLFDLQTDIQYKCSALFFCVGKFQ